MSGFRVYLKHRFWILISFMLFTFYYMLIGKAMCSQCVSDPPFGARRLLVDGEIVMLDASLDKLRGFKRNESSGAFSEFTVGERDVEHYDSMVVGNLDGEGEDEIVIADASDDKIHIFSHDLSEIGSFNAGIERYDDIALGDVNGDGQLEIILGDASDPSGKGIRVFDSSGNELGWIKISGGYERYDRVDAGDVDGDGVDEIVHGDASDDNIHVYKWNSSTQGHFSGVTQFNMDYSREDEIAVGDVDSDGIAEIIFAEGTNGAIEDNRHRIVVYDKDGNVIARSVDIGFEGSDTLAAGDIDLDNMAEIIVGKDADGTIHVFEVGQNGVVAEGNSFSVGYDSGDKLAVGDVDGGSVMVGEPVCRGQLVMDDVVVAVINAPPKHDGVNNDPDVFKVGYEHSTTETTTNIITAESNFSFTVGVSYEHKFAKIVSLESSLNYTYNQSTKTTEGTKISKEIGEGLVADQRDRQITISTTYDVYEYPVIDEDGNQIYVDGEPQFLAVNVPVSMDVPTIGYYTSSIHTLGDITSYPHETSDLINYPGVSIYDTNFVIGPDPSYGYIKKSDSHFNSSKYFHEHKVDWSVAVSAWGAGLNLKGNYSSKEITTHKFEFTDTTSLKIEYDGGITDEDKYYSAHAIAYYDSEDGHFVLDWLVPSYGDYYTSSSSFNIPASILGPPVFIPPLDVPSLFAISLPTPSGANAYEISANDTTSRDEDPSKCRPIGVTGDSGTMLTVSIDLPAFAEPADIYFGIYAPALAPGEIFLITNNGDNITTISSSGLVPYISFTSGNIKQDVLSNIPLSLLPEGDYYFYLLLSPANQPPMEDYYLWWTTFSHRP